MGKATQANLQSGQRVSFCLPPSRHLLAEVARLLPASTYPYFPGEIINHNEEHDALPRDVLKAEQHAREQAKGSHIWLVRFFDRTSSYAWVGESRLANLGVDDGECSGLFSGFPRPPHGYKNQNLDESIEERADDL